MYGRTRQQRRAKMEFWLLLGTFAVSVFVAGWVVGGATASPPPSRRCYTTYPYPPTIPVYVLGQVAGEVNIHPLSASFVSCLRANLAQTRRVPR